MLVTRSAVMISVRMESSGENAENQPSWSNDKFVTAICLALESPIPIITGFALSPMPKKTRIFQGIFQAFLKKLCAWLSDSN
jgi:hypothetical protein